jgi:cation transport protein ChaC
VFRVPAAEGEEVLHYLYEREMVTAVYRPRWLSVRTDQGMVRAAAFVVDHEHTQYAGRLSEAELIDLVIQGRGQNGACLDYLEKTVHHLDALGLTDRALKRLLRLAHARLGR